MSKKAWSIPNFITIIRLALVPVLIISYMSYSEEKYYIPGIIFLAAAFTDVIDGFIARKFNMITDVGKVLDPLADKLFVTSMLVCFAIKNSSPAILILLIVTIIKELYLIIAGILLYSRKYVVQSKPIGKVATLALNLGIFVYFFGEYNPIIKTIAEVILFIGIVLSISAAIYYTIMVYKSTGGKLPPKDKK